MVTTLPPLMNSAIMLTAAMRVMYVLCPSAVFVQGNGGMLLVAIIAAYFIIGELVNGLQWLGIGLILGGILISENKT
ncbi:hypothetical protein HQN90_37295 [Paenibacillus alba]|nr:hypothetical protein [Paenibacillus alba]